MQADRPEGAANGGFCKNLNCVIWENTQSVADMQYTAQYTCSTYLADGVDGNTNMDPKLTDDFHLGM